MGNQPLLVVNHGHVPFELQQLGLALGVVGSLEFVLKEGEVFKLGVVVGKPGAIVNQQLV